MADRGRGLRRRLRAAGAAGARGDRGPVARRCSAPPPGILFALSAALTKTVASELSGGVVALATSWPLYALAFVGYVSMTINQISLDARRAAGDDGDQHRA